eukprot:3498567-Pyramimonas_sp.AAC.1
MAKSSLSLRRTHSAGPPAAIESGDGFASRSPPGMARSNLSTPLRCPHQQPSKLATISQIAAPPPSDGEV